MSEQMQAGLELDALVAEKVFGRLITWNRVFQYPTEEERKEGRRSFVDIPEYSTDWNAVRLVVEEMQRRGLSVFINNYDPNFIFTVHFRDEDGEKYGGVFGKEIPHLVCLSALETIQALEADHA